MNTRTQTLPMSADRATWRDPKRYAWPLVPLWILTPVFSIYLAVVTGQAAWYWLAVVLTYIVFPILDLDALVGRDTRNPPEAAVPKLEMDRYYTWILYLTVPCHYITLFAGAWAVGTQHLSVLSYIGVAWSCGLMNGFAVATAHELGHKKSAWPMRCSSPRARSSGTSRTSTASSAWPAGSPRSRRVGRRGWFDDRQVRGLMLKPAS